MTDQAPVPADRDGGDQPGVADRVARAVRAVPGVSGLHAGSLGQVGTLLPGRRVDGVRVADESTEVHLSVTMGHPITPLADAVVAAVREITGTPVQVVVEDVVPADPEPQPGPDPEPSAEPTAEPAAEPTGVHLPHPDTTTSEENH